MKSIPSGKTIGVLDNSKPNADKLAERLAELLKERYGVAGVVTRQLESARSFEVTFWRSLFTLLSLAVILPLWQGSGVWRRIPWRSPYFWLSGLCWSVMFTAFMVALTLTVVANVLITMAIGPLVTALFTRVVLRHALPWRTWGAIVLAGCGIPTGPSRVDVVNPTQQQMGL